MNEIICKFRVEPFRMEVFEAVAGESSIGTWVRVNTMKPRIAKMRPRIFGINPGKKTVKIAYPLDLFELGNIPQLLSSVAGNIFGMKMIKSLKLEDIEFPRKYIKSFEGPKFGIEGIRKLLGVKKRPLVGTIIKPKLGLKTKEHAKVAYQAWIGGCDIVKDDENLSNQDFNPFKQRVKETLKMRNKAERKTGERKIYMPNVTAETEEMLKRARFVKRQRGEYVMLDILTVGWAALQSLKEADLGLVIHAHRAMHAAMTRNPKHGISMIVLAKLARLIGVDQIHIGALAKMEADEKEVVAIAKGIVMKKDWYHIKPVFAVCSGGLHPTLIPRLIHLLGKDIIIQAGGGCHGHPGGTIAGAKALRQSINATLQNVSLIEYTKNHKELKAAIDKWGYK